MEAHCKIGGIQAEVDVHILSRETWKIIFWRDLQVEQFVAGVCVSQLRYSGVATCRRCFAKMILCDSCNTDGDYINVKLELCSKWTQWETCKDQQQEMLEFKWDLKLPMLADSILWVDKMGCVGEEEQGLPAELWASAAATSSNSGE